VAIDRDSPAGTSPAGSSTSGTSSEATEMSEYDIPGLAGGAPAFLRVARRGQPAAQAVT
jgi:hypothetical protein